MNGNHYYSAYVDKQFSFNNEIYPTKYDTNKSKNMMCGGNIMLEPRLQEYMKKKKIYKQNNINMDISLEKEFGITSIDKSVMKDFLLGKKDMYTRNPNEFYDMQKKKVGGFPSKEYRDKDSRVIKINNKTETNVINRGMFYDDNNNYYKEDMPPLDLRMDSRDFSGGNKYDMNGELDGLFHTNDDKYGWNLNEDRFNPRIDAKIYPGIENHNKNNSQYRVKGDNRNNYIINNMMEDNEGSYSDVFKEPQRHINYDDMRISEKSDIDYDSRKFIPNVSSNSKRDMNTSIYTRNNITRNEQSNIDAENELLLGMPHNSKKKTYGFRSVDEHNYDYIDNDFQHPDNVVLPFPRGGEGTRQYGKGLAKNNGLRRL